MTISSIVSPIVNGISSGIIAFNLIELSPIVWLDASDLSTITLNSGNVSAWNDKSGNGNNATEATAESQPAYAANGITFDGVDDALLFENTFTSAGGGSTVFIVCEPKSIWINYILGNVGGGANKSRYYIREHAIDFGDTQINHSGLTINTRSLISTWAGTGDATTQNVKVDKGDWVSGAVNRGTIAGSQSLGSRGGSSSYSNVVLHEIVVFDKLLSASDHQNVENYLYQKWSIGNLEAPEPELDCGTNFGADGGPIGGYQENSIWRGVNSTYGIVFVGNSTNTAVWRSTPVVAAPESTLTSAVITWDTDASQPFPAYKHFIMRVRGVKDGRAAQVGSGNLPLDQVFTTAFVDVDISTWTGVNATGYWAPSGDTIDVTEILNEIIGDPCWVSGNHPQFIFSAQSYPVGNAFTSFDDQAGSDPLTLAYS